MTISLAMFEGLIVTSLAGTGVLFVLLICYFFVEHKGKENVE